MAIDPEHGLFSGSYCFAVFLPDHQCGAGPTAEVCSSLIPSLRLFASSPLIPIPGPSAVHNLSRHPSPWRVRSRDHRFLIIPITLLLIHLFHVPFRFLFCGPCSTTSPRSSPLPSSSLPSFPLIIAAPPSRSLGVCHASNAVLDPARRLRLGGS